LGHGLHAPGLTGVRGLEDGSLVTHRPGHVGSGGDADIVEIACCSGWELSPTTLAAHAQDRAVFTDDQSQTNAIGESKTAPRRAEQNFIDY
jgi:hypothetical protein